MVVTNAPTHSPLAALASLLLGHCVTALRADRTRHSMVRDQIRAPHRIEDHQALGATAFPASQRVAVNALSRTARQRLKELDHVYPAKSLRTGPAQLFTGDTALGEPADERFGVNWPISARLAAVLTKVQPLTTRNI